jgi:hypothetical protein
MKAFKLSTLVRCCYWKCENTAQLMMFSYEYHLQAAMLTGVTGKMWLSKFSGQLVLFCLQVWCARYNQSGSKIVSVSEDRAVHIYDCPV